jgi:hypothetical protein
MKPLAILLVLALAGTAAAQDPPRDPLKDIKVGDRVELILKNGFSIQGQLIALDPKVTEVEKMKVIVLDIGYEYPELKGHVGVERVHVKSSRKLARLELKDLEIREKARQEALKRMETEDMSRRARMAERDIEIEKERKEAEKKEKAEKMKGLGADLQAKAELLKKGAEFYAKFPPSAGWGQEKAKEITQKAFTHVPVTADEREFMGGIELWMSYRNYVEEQKSKEKEKEAVEDVKKEPSPAPKEEAPK